MLGVVLFGAFSAAAIFRDVQLPQQDAFVPTANAVILVNDVITTALLCAHFSITRHRALLVLAGAFLFKALILVPHGLTFPGAFAPAGLLHARMQTTAWLYLTQHIVFLLGAIAYTVLRDRPDRAPTSDTRASIPIAASLTAVAAAALCLTWVMTAEASRLPPIMADAVHTSAGFARVGQPLLVALGLTSIFVFRRRATSMIDLWLQVAVLSWLFETLLTAIVQTRFSLVFYVSRTMGVVSSSFVLIAFLFESLMLHRRLVLATVAREQEREGHRTAVDIIVGSLAHELRQPLASILINENAGRQMLSTEPMEHDEVRAAFADIRESAIRANEIIDSVRSMYAPSQRTRGPVDVNDVATQAVELMRTELETHHVAIDVALSPGLPAIQGHRGQLLEVLLNGLKNGLDSLVAVSDRTRRLCVRTAPRGEDGVSISIEDFGGGLDPRLRGRLFEPFHTTKPGGMGLGLSICQSIVSAHGGALSLIPGTPNGAVFRVDLPASPAADAPNVDLANLEASYQHGVGQ